MKLRDFERVIKEFGYKYLRRNGSHKIYKDREGKLISVPDHNKFDLNRMMARRLLKEIGAEYQHV